MLDERLQRILKDFEVSIGARTTDLGQRATIAGTSPVFHYTNAAGLNGILEKDALWLTDRIHLNDPSELAYGMKFALDWCTEKAKGGDRLAQQFFGTLGMGLPAVLERHGFYVSSFSLDGNTLAQWCRYADDKPRVLPRVSSGVLEFWVEDHRRLGHVLNKLRRRGYQAPTGELPDGCAGVYSQRGTLQRRFASGMETIRGGDTGAEHLRASVEHNSIQVRRISRRVRGKGSYEGRPCRIAIVAIASDATSRQRTGLVHRTSVYAIDSSSRRAEVCSYWSGRIRRIDKEHKGSAAFGGTTMRRRNPIEDSVPISLLIRALVMGPKHAAAVVSSRQVLSLLSTGRRISLLRVL